ncbi:MAG: hypothetical protein HOP17_17565 [Acidobacteria bacterium]|nr:hypothetical protein [Acidobacteriota bacterium]
MITGFNTDIEHEGVTYHVQTEDKGKSKPIILSLVYDRGTILASKRSPYDDLLDSNFSERVLAERLSKQHKLICAAIKAGRLEDLKKLSEREAKGTITAKSETVAAEKKVLLDGVSAAAAAKPEKPVSVSLDDFKAAENPIPKPAFETEAALDEAGLIDEPIIEAVAIIEDDVVLPAEAVAIISEPAFTERPDNKKLCIEILGDVKFRGGERNTVGFMVSRGTSRKVVSGAEIMVKILGSSFRPIIFHATTDSNGVATVNMQMPTFSTGRAAFLVRAISDGEEIELRRSIAHG